MNIKVFPDYGKKVSYIFKRPQLGENFVTLIALFYNASEMKLHYTIESDEFSNIAKNIALRLTCSIFQVLYLF